MLKPDTVAAIRLLYSSDEEWTVGRIADALGVSGETVSKIITGRTWKEITGGVNISRRTAATALHLTVIEARMSQGVTNYQKIADELGITRQAVGKLVRKHGIGGRSCSAM
jgi:predicted transcriptional regulator